MHMYYLQKLIRGIAARTAILQLDTVGHIFVTASASALAHELGINVDFGHIVHDYSDLETLQSGNAFCQMNDQYGLHESLLYH